VYAFVMKTPEEIMIERELRAALMQVLRGLAIGIGVLLGVFFVVRAVVELLTIEYSDPSSYADDWGGPSLAGCCSSTAASEWCRRSRSSTAGVAAAPADARSRAGSPTRSARRGAGSPTTRSARRGAGQLRRDPRSRPQTP
jgi:hypothetical protein